MEIDQPGPGEQLNSGGETVPRQAATVILLRGSDAGLEVLLVKRNPESRFMAGAWVFPGGAVKRPTATAGGSPRRRPARAGRGGGRPPRRSAGARALLPLDHSRRGQDPLRHLVLPRHRSPPGQQPEVDGAEVVDLGWYRPAAALEAARDGQLLLVFPTIKHLEQLSPSARPAS